MSLPINRNLDDALVHHRAGRLPEAEKRYRGNSERKPRSCRCLHLLGLIGQNGANDAAIDLMDETAKQMPPIERIF